MKDKYNGMRLARDWVGKHVFLAREIETGAAKYPAGLGGVITDQSSTGMSFEADACKCCGTKPYIRRLNYFDVTLTPNDQK